MFLFEVRHYRVPETDFFGNIHASPESEQLMDGAIPFEADIRA